jgi:hypothetical protein
VKEIKLLLQTKNFTVPRIAELYEVGLSTIQNIKNNRNRKHIETPTNVNIETVNIQTVNINYTTGEQLKLFDLDSFSN